MVTLSNYVLKNKFRYVSCTINDVTMSFNGRNIAVDWQGGKI